MNIISIIEKKKNNEVLTEEEIDYFINGYTLGIISDAQASALLMAICINGMNDDETYYMTKAMVNSGDTLNLSSIDGIKVDKHSTGGVGDKTTLIVAPIVASASVKVAKLSGKGLGHTGGTIDKLDSISGFNSNLTEEEFIKQVQDIGIVDAMQTKDLVPSDKKIYALRDVTGTTRSIPLIASSIMSKKIAAGADKIVLDVKTGSGALITDLKDSVELAKLMVSIGKKYNKETVALITNMDEPLGCTIGNALEVKEAIEVLEGVGNEKLTKLCLTISAYMISMGKNISLDDALKEAIEALESKKALEKFKEFIKYQGGDINKIEVSDKTFKVYSNTSGYLNDIDETKLAILCSSMGSGRQNKEDKINYKVGIKINKHMGDYINKNDLLATIYYDDKKISEDEVRNCFIITSVKEEELPLIYGVIK